MLLNETKCEVEFATDYDRKGVKRPDPSCAMMSRAGYTPETMSCPSLILNSLSYEEKKSLLGVVAVSVLNLDVKCASSERASKGSVLSKSLRFHKESKTCCTNSSK